MIEPEARRYSARRYLGRVELSTALDAQADVARAVRAGQRGVLLGFECESVITLGLRGTTADLTRPDQAYLRVDRGGRATLHNPGQLVIFPVTTTFGLGPRAWVLKLVEVTRQLAAEHGQALEWREAEPGLYSPRGKVASIGLRLAHGVSTHGLSINVRNDLKEFSRIRTCGVANASLDHLRTRLGLADLFDRWVTCFDQSVT